MKNEIIIHLRKKFDSNLLNYLKKIKLIFKLYLINFIIKINFIFKIFKNNI